MTEDQGGGPPRVQLGKHVLDKGILDRDGLRCGKVDDVVLELAGDGSPPVVVALVTGPTALARTLGRPAAWLARLCCRALGVPDPQPIAVAWDHIAAIDVSVHLDCDSEGTALQAVPDAARRIIAVVPGSR